MSEPTLYAYVGGNPLSYVDPTGLNPAIAAPVVLGGGALLLCASSPSCRQMLSDITLFTLRQPGEFASNVNTCSKKWWKENDSSTLAGEGVDPPGNCSQDHYDYLKEQKGLACNVKRSCNAQVDTCAEIMGKMVNNNACINARNDVMNQCFNGGDKRHQLERENARDVLGDCIAAAAIKRCSGF